MLYAGDASLPRSECMPNARVTRICGLLMNRRKDVKASRKRKQKRQVSERNQEDRNKAKVVREVVEKAGSMLTNCSANSLKLPGSRVHNLVKGVAGMWIPDKWRASASTAGSDCAIRKTGMAS